VFQEHASLGRRRPLLPRRRCRHGGCAESWGHLSRAERIRWADREGRREPPHTLWQAQIRDGAASICSPSLLHANPVGSPSGTVAVTCLLPVTSSTRPMSGSMRCCGGGAWREVRRPVVCRSFLRHVSWGEEDGSRAARGSSSVHSSVRFQGTSYDAVCCLCFFGKRAHEGGD